MQIHNKDCLEIMKSMQDNQVDLIVTDPPYGIKEAAGNNKKRGTARAKAIDFGDFDWDNAIPSKEYFDEMMRVSKNQIIFGGNYFIEYLKNSSCWIIWDKLNGDTDFADCELAWTSFSSAVRKVSIRWNGYLQQSMTEKEVRIHPTQKPVRLFEWILERYAKKGNIIFDPFLGSGSCAIAAFNLGFDFIGVEKEKRHYDDADTRIKQAIRQPRLGLLQDIEKDIIHVNTLF